ncbi:WD repeat-containing protein 35 [Chamberlinius hualienensis]
MFVYLSKKIAIPNNVKLKCVAWNKSQGYLACGGENALLKVLQLDSGRTSNHAKGPQASNSNLSMNQTLDGHAGNGSVQIVRWNESAHQKLTSADQYGLITVWMLYKGSWSEDMINNRNKSVVTDMKWSSDGQKICIVYEDGAVIVGSVEGNRIWNRDLKGVSLTHVEWSPNGQLLLFGLANGDVHIFDNSGNVMGDLSMKITKSDEEIVICDIHWYNGKGGYVEANCPCLAICYVNGQVQIMRNENDEEPVIFNCGEIRVVGIEWNFDGSILAVAGISKLFEGGVTKECNTIQFYSPYGEHLQTLKLPGKEIVGCSWEGGGLRIALAIDSFIYFANIRPNYKWCYFANTVVYTYSKADRTDKCVVFWNTKTNERCVKYVKSLLSIAANQEYCVLATRSEDDNDQFALVVCNSIGTPVDSKYISLCPISLSMSPSYILAASKDKVIVWRFHTPQVTSAFKLGKIDGDSSERAFHIDEIPWKNPDNDLNYQEHTYSPLVCICNSDKTAVLARKLGLIQHFSLPNMNLINNIKIDCQPYSIALNCTSTKLSVISDVGSVIFIDLIDENETDVTEHSKTAIQHLDKKDIWDLKWSVENFEMFAAMEKARMYVYRKLDPEEPTICNGYICHFENLQIKTVLLDELLLNPENTETDIVVTMEVKSLRDTRDLLEKVGIKDAMQFIEDNPHPRLWKLLGEAALEKIDLQVAETAFVHCRNYPSIDFVKQLHNIQNTNLRKAEIAAYFHRFDDADKIFLENDRRDLAISLRRKLGDWFRVVQLLKSGSTNTDDTVYIEAWNAIGDYYADRQRWEEAVKYYEQSFNHKQLLEGYFILEDYNKLENLAHTLPEGNPLFNDIAEMFVTVGMCEQAVYAYIKCGNVKAAIDCCITLNNWGKAVELAERHRINDISPLLAKYALYLLEKNKTLSAVELYRKAGRNLDALKLLINLAKEESEKQTPSLLIKRLYVLAGLALEEYRRQMAGSSKQNSSSVIASLLEEENIMASSSESKIGSLEDAWNGAEAYHFYFLTQKHLYEGHYDLAMKTAVQLQNYESILNKEEIYLLLALASSANRAFGVCSKAFTKLESLECIPNDRRETYEKLATDIFTSFPPKDTRTNLVDCPTCNSKISDWSSTCPNCNTHFKICMATGCPLFDATNQWTCHRCKRCAHVQYMISRKTCPLCHVSI